MAKISGHGGYVLLDAVSDTRIDNISYEYDIEEVIDDVTDSGSSGVAEGLAILYKVNSVVIEVFDNDSVSFATAVGVTEGATITIFCKKGTNAKADKFTGTIVRNVHVSNTQTGARRVRITTEFGTLARAQDLPS